MDGPEFIKAIRDWANQDVPELVKIVHQKITLEALSRLVGKTPVATGRARGNWQVGIGARPAGQVEGLQLLMPHDPPLATLPPPTFAPAGNQALEAGQNVIDRIKPFVVAHVTNNVVYIIPLEDGHSRQGAHMLETTFEELAEMFA
jgi:hypothetical protein